MIVKAAEQTIDALIDALQAGETISPIGRYKLLRLLGRGSMGAVFHAQDIVLKRAVALKLFPKRFQQGERSAELQQFIREARSAARIDSPHVVRIYDINISDGWLHIAMELIDGTNLLHVMRNAGPMAPERVCRIGGDAAAALAAAHQLKVVHRDIKPANLMVTLDSRCKVTDFGLACAHDPEDQFKLPTESVGTPYYIAPEVAMGKSATPASDVYSLGATLWHLLAGRPIYPGKVAKDIAKQHIHSPLPDLRELRPELPGELVAILERMLAKAPADRFQDVAEVAKRLKRCAKQLAAAPEAKSGSALFPGAAGGGSQMFALAQAVEQMRATGSQAASSSRMATPVRPGRRMQQTRDTGRTRLFAGIAGLAIVSVALGAAAVMFFNSSPTPEQTTSQTPAQTATANTSSPPPEALQATSEAAREVDMQATQEQPPASRVQTTAAAPVQPAPAPEVAPAAPVDAGPPAAVAKDEADTAATADAGTPLAAETLPGAESLPEVERLLRPSDTAGLLAIADAGDTRTYGVQGVVTSAELSSSGKVFRIHLDHLNGRNVFVAVAFPATYDALARAFGGEHGEGLLNKKVIITGRIIKYDQYGHNDPEIIIDNPAQIIVTP